MTWVYKKNYWGFVFVFSIQKKNIMLGSTWPHGHSADHPLAIHSDVTTIRKWENVFPTLEVQVPGRVKFSLIKYQALI